MSEYIPQKQNKIIQIIKIYKKEIKFKLQENNKKIKHKLFQNIIKFFLKMNNLIYKEEYF